MLTRSQLRGLWISVPTEWDENGNFDEKVFRDEVAMLIHAGADGLYTTGSTGEYYALDWEEWKKVQDAFLAETGNKIPVQVGANWFNTNDTIKRVRYARDNGADGVQVCFPGWMEMRPEDYDQFFIDIYNAVPDIALIHYNISRSKKLFLADDYRRILADVPTLIGTKAGVSFDELINLFVKVPEINHFAGELIFPLAHQLGCKGSYSSWFIMNPDFFRNHFNQCEEGRYNEAVATLKRFAEWRNSAVIPLIKKGYLDPSLDKAFFEMSGWWPGNRRTRKPYSPLSDEDMKELRRVTKRIMPEFLDYRI